ncbi:MAG: hypothetical protein HUU29_07710 [Planctomycetaceae bacterium]|nr:hypothetical protein [Planctomycetaceae bacterium]
MKRLIVVTMLLGSVFGIGCASANAKRDVQQLTKFQQSLAVSIWGDVNKRRFIENIAEQETTAQLLLELWNTRMISSDNMRFLAGASGEEVTDQELRAGTFSPEMHCIFSGPRDGKTLVELFDGTREGILFAYNKHWIDQHPDVGIVVLFAKEKTARLLIPAALEQEYQHRTGKAVTLPADLKQVYGKPPFEHVSPE